MAGEKDAKNAPKCQEDFLADIKQNPDGKSYEGDFYSFERVPSKFPNRHKELWKQGNWIKTKIGDTLKGDNENKIVDEYVKLLPNGQNTLNIVVPDDLKSKFNEVKINGKELKVYGRKEVWIGIPKIEVLKAQLDKNNIDSFDPDILIVGNLDLKLNFYNKTTSCTNPLICLNHNGKKYAHCLEVNEKDGNIKNLEKIKSKKMISNVEEYNKIKVAWFTDDKLKNYYSSKEDDDYIFTVDSMSNFFEEKCPQTGKPLTNECIKLERFQTLLQFGSLDKSIKEFTLVNIEPEKGSIKYVNQFSLLDKIEGKCALTSGNISNQLNCPLCMFLTIFIIVLAGKIIIA